MLDLDLPDGPGSPLVRGFTACLSSVTEVAVRELPALAEDETLPHALGAWKSWLAGRGSGLVPVAEPGSFQWAGWWIGVVDDSLSPLGHGSRRQVAVVAFGTPPGVVLSPQDASLLGRATADLPVSSAFVVAPLDPVLRPAPPRRERTGRVELLAVAPDAEVPMRLVTAVRALAGLGLEGDRYARHAGTFGPRAGHRSGYDLTLIAAEVVDELGARDARLDFASTRRNVLTRGIDVNDLVGRDFRIGEVLCRGLRLAEPCAHLERLTGPGLLRPLIHRGGLRADVLGGGSIRPGDLITT